MIKQKKWHITLHQILKPIMIPTYRFYNEQTSTSIPNIYRLRSDQNSSHFTAYRILNKLAIRNESYVSISELKIDFLEIFHMEDDFLLNIDLLLKRGLIESENGIDKLTEDLQKVKISSFGYYMQQIIFKDFTYLELISSDISVLDKQTANQLIKYSNEDYRLLKEAQANKEKEQENRYKRIKTRISKVNTFCRYLNEQEELEQKKYSIDSQNMISKKIKNSIDDQIKKSILPSAKKNLNIKSKTNKQNKHGIKKLD
jgi:hypothetical protein